MTILNLSTLCVYLPLLLAQRSKGNNKRTLQVTGSGKSLHDPVSMYGTESMASLKEKLARAEEVCVYAVWAHTIRFTHIHMCYYSYCVWHIIS